MSAERAIEDAHFDDRLGTLPVEVSLSHNGVSTLETGILGRLYWQQTGTFGFGATVRVQGPPEAAGTLASYVDPGFIRTNAQFVSDPGAVAQAYGSELRSDVLRRFLTAELLAAAAALVLVIVLRLAAPSGSVRARAAVVLVTGGVVLTAGSALLLFARWDGNTAVGPTFPMPDVGRLSFSSPQTLEVARQVRPFIEKNADRIARRSEEYRATATAALRRELERRAVDLRPADGEQIVIAEADPQGSLVGNELRAAAYPVFEEILGEDAFALRTISGDVTSNGTVAEADFVRDEAEASPGIPVVAVSGDHDTETTVDQMEGAGMVDPSFEVRDVAGIQVTGADDPAFKTLFGGLVVDEGEDSEEQLGSDLRQTVDTADPVLVLLHQPRAASGYLGIDDLSDLDSTGSHDRIPVDDGIPDLPPGIINVGHLHDLEPPRVIWNTDGDDVTWTVVNQLGTSGGAEESPTFNRFSTPFSVPLKALSVQLQYVDTESGLETGYADIAVAPDGTVRVGRRHDLGLPRGTSGAD